MLRRHVVCCTLTIGLLVACLQPGHAQEKSVRPGINDSFQNPDVSQFVERFEREGREVYDHREKIVAACPIKPGMTVADIGAGTGLFTRLLAPKVGAEGELLAVDIAKPFVDHVVASCRELGLKQVSGVVCTPTSVELPDESVDLAFICDTYHHFEFPYKTMRSLHRALKPGGQVVLVEFHRKEGVSSEWIMGHVRAGQDVFVEEIQQAGFEVVSEEDFLATSYLMRFKKSDRKTPAGHTQDSLKTVQKLLADQTATLIDVREQNEWDRGHLADATLVPLSRINAAVRSGGDSDLLKSLPQDKIIYCHCRSGGRVLQATKLLEPLGYDIRPLKSGYADLLKADFPKAE